jgi:ketosteroid isomerase-like protein
LNFLSLTLRIRGLLVSGEKVAVSVETRAILTGTGQPLERSGIWVLVFEGDRIRMRSDY